MVDGKVFKIIVVLVFAIFGIAGWVLYLEKNSNSTTDTLSNGMTISYVRAIVWYHSRGKLQELRSIMLNDDLSNQEKIKIRITNMLKHRTSAYIRDFNALKTPVQHLGDWYTQNFEFDRFLQVVFTIVFNEKMTVEERVRDISDVMEQYQNMTTQKLIAKLDKQKG